MAALPSIREGRGSQWRGLEEMTNSLGELHLPPMYLSCQITRTLHILDR